MHCITFVKTDFFPGKIDIFHEVLYIVTAGIFMEYSYLNLIRILEENILKITMDEIDFLHFDFRVKISNIFIYQLFVQCKNDVFTGLLEN